MSEKLSRLEVVEVSDVWPDEAQDFTPWLAAEENLAFLGKTLGLKLQFEAQEIRVGDFRADILCRDPEDPENETRVLIENQLKETDHKHLGQILTYSAGLDANTVIWIAPKFRDEHRAALDWLNEATDEKFRYFGVEIQVWRIGDSARAPQFHVVSSPNNWSRNMQSTVGKDLSDTQLQQYKYWTEFQDYMIQKGSQIKLPEPKAQHNFDIRIGTAGTVIRPWVYKNNYIGVTLNLKGKKGKTHFQLLKEQCNEIETQLDESLEWEEKPDQNNSKITLRKENTDPTNETDWQNQHEWLATKVELFYQIFKPRIDELKNADSEPEDENDE